VVDVIAVLTDSPNPRNYWKVLKHRLLEDEGSQVVTNCNQFKMMAADGKMRPTDCMTTEQLFRLIQSVPSPKAEPFKLWMAQVARERLDEIMRKVRSETAKKLTRHHSSSEQHIPTVHITIFRLRRSSLTVSA
jgi:hypothetical protein